MAETLARQQKSLQGIDATVQSLQESVTALARELDQQTRTQMQQAQKSGTQEGLLQGMREEFAASQKQTDLALAELQKQTDLALAELQKQLAESRAELAALKTNQGESYDRLILYGGGAALALMVLLTIVLAVRSGSSRRHAEKRKLPTRHEL